MRVTLASWVVFALVACLTDSVTAQKISAAERTCALDAFTIGKNASAGPGCVLVAIKNTGKPKVIDAGLVFASKVDIGACNILTLYVGSFQPKDGLDPSEQPGYVVTDWCSPKGLGLAYYNGVHEGFHTKCPSENSEDSNDCEELAATAMAAANACETVGAIVACTSDPVGPECTETALTDLKTDFPELFDGDGNLDSDKAREFAKGLCAGIKEDRKTVDREAAAACACGDWNTENPQCTVPELPSKTDGTSYCDDEPPYPTEEQDPDWPIPDCGGCDSLGS
jgi:hypothetical protein